MARHIVLINYDSRSETHTWGMCLIPSERKSMDASAPGSFVRLFQLAFLLQHDRVCTVGEGCAVVEKDCFEFSDETMEGFYQLLDH